MKSWKLSEAKTHFSEVVASVKKEPQVITSRQKPVAVLVDFDGFEELQALKKAAERPSITELLVELKEIYEDEQAEFELPQRIDRVAPTFD
ncbi:MAG: type II toxin-antitoxin system Phd/YefM family antitoxin [Verrucomicrobiota bacterium]